MYIAAKRPEPPTYKAGCPKCGAADGLLRVSKETALFTQPVKALHWNGPRRVRVAAEGEQTYIQEGVRTVAVRCASCGFEGDPWLFAREIVASEVLGG